MTNRLPPLIWIFPFLLVGLSSSASAQNSAVDPVVPALPALPTILQALKEPSPAHLRQAELVWQQQQSVLGTDVLTRYAMALAFVGNNRHTSAYVLMESLPEPTRQAGPLRRLWIWLAVKMRKDEIAQREFQRLMDELTTQANPGPPASNQLEDLQFAAKLITYLEVIAEREAPLDVPQSKDWWAKLEALPDTWRKELPALRSAMQDEKVQLERQLQENYAAWLAKTNQELAEVKERLAAFKPQELDAQQQYEAAVAQHQDFLKLAAPQMDTLQRQAASAQATLRSLFPPLEPARPARDSKGNLAAGAERAYERAMENYRSSVRSYQNAVAQCNNTIAGANRQAAVLTRQDEGFQRKIAQEFAQLKKIQNPRETADKNHERLTKTLLENASWDRPASLAKLRALEAYRLINLNAEAERIERKRG